MLRSYNMCNFKFISILHPPHSPAPVLETRTTWCTFQTQNIKSKKIIPKKFLFLRNKIYPKNFLYSGKEPDLTRYSNFFATRCTFQTLCQINKIAPKKISYIFQKLFLYFKMDADKTEKSKKSLYHFILWDGC